MVVEIEINMPRKSVSWLSQCLVDGGFYSFQKDLRSEELFNKLKHVTQLGGVKVSRYQYDLLYKDNTLVLIERTQKPSIINVVVMGGEEQDVITLVRSLESSSEGKVSITIDPRSQRKAQEVEKRVKGVSPFGKFVETETEKAFIFEDKSVKDLYSGLKKWRGPYQKMARNFNE
ncbi:MAG: hypothetical protein QMC77_06800 [Methanocellales archaeon]|nr:hypothetical protein [Methanocellales archaeon]